MKVDVDYEKVHKVMDKLQGKEAITQDEADSVLKVLNAVIGDYIPSKEEVELQKSNVERLDNIEPNTDAWKTVMKQVNEFEGKYC